MTATVFTKGSTTQTAIVAETTPGTTPTTPTMLIIPDVKLDLEFAQNTYDDTSIFGDRMEHDVIQGIRKVSGSMSVNLSHSNFAPLIKTAMFSSWTAKVIKTGNTWNTITIEEWHIDTSIGRVSTGCFVDKAAIKVPVNGIVTADFTIAGMAQTTETTQLDATPTAAVVEVPFTHLGGTILEGGTALGYISAIDLTIDNGATELSVLGAQTPIGYTAGMSKVTGTLTAWVPDLTLFNKFYNQTQTSINFTLTDGTNTLEFNIPNVTYTSAKMPVAGQNAVSISLAFKAVKDPTTGSNLVITYS